MLRKSFIAVLVVLLATPALADTRLSYADEQSGEEQSVITIKDGKVRMDNAGSSSWTLYDTNDGSLITVDPDARTWTSLDEETLQKAAGQVSAAMARMRAQLEQMPPEQRARIEKMMGGMADAGRKMVETKVDRTGKTQHKAGHDCEQVFMSVGSLSRSEVCVAAPDALDIPAADTKVLEAMQERMKKFAQSMSQSFGAGPSFDFDSLGGVPVYTKQEDEHTGQILKGVSHTGIEAGLFHVPDGYHEKKISLDD